MAPPATLVGDRDSILASIEAEPEDDGQEHRGDAATSYADDLSEGIEEASGATEGDEPADDGREKFIPRERFDEIHGKYTEAQTRIQELADLEAYRADVEAAKAYGYSTPGQLAAAIQQQRQAEQERQQRESLEAEFQEHAAMFGEESAKTHTATKMLLLQSQEQLRQVQAQTYQHTVQSEFDKIKEHLPEDVREKAFNLVKNTNLEFLPTLLSALQEIAVSSANNAKVQYATGKTTTAPVPVGAASTKGAVSTPTSAKFAKKGGQPVNESYSTLMMREIKRPA